VVATGTPRFRVRRAILAAAFFVALAAGAPGAWADPPGTAPDGRFITLASTTSTRNSGLLDAILPVFTEKTGIVVRVVAVGTGQALRLARRGDADVLLVHDRASEEAFVAEGFGVERYGVMHNDFVVVGPSADPAEIAGGRDASAALARIAASGAPFASRGDDSGTHKGEMRLWRAAGVDPTGASGGWYRETGSGMGATLNTAAAMDAYTLSDRGTWLSFRNRRGLAILVEGDPRLFNPYGVILVNPERHPHVKAALGQTFIDWLLSAEGQGAIADFRIDGQTLFFPDAAPAGGG
jgi:tungstate transport system substrate-binding protein